MNKINEKKFNFILLIVVASTFTSTASLASTFNAAVAQFSTATGSCNPIFNSSSFAEESYANTAQGVGDASAKAFSGGFGVGTFANSSSVGSDLTFNNQIGACGRASASFTDVVITGGTPGTTITTSFSVRLTGSNNAGASGNGASSARHEAVVISPGGVRPVSGSAAASTSGIDSELLSVNEVINSGDFTVTVGQAFTIELQLTSSAFTSAKAIPGPSGLQFGASSSQSDFFSTLAFVSGEPVFDLPEGFTVNSVDGNIVDNNFVGAVPVPAAIWLFGSGLLGLVSIGRHKKA